MRGMRTGAAFSGGSATFPAVSGAEAVTFVSPVTSVIVFLESVALVGGAPAVVPVAVVGSPVLVVGEAVTVPCGEVAGGGGFVVGVLLVVGVVEDVVLVVDGGDCVCCPSAVKITSR